jgi:serine/threonine protein kinase/tetratricopeptide (TPR) repeat protein
MKDSQNSSRINGAEEKAGDSPRDSAALAKGAIKITNILEDAERTFLPAGSPIGKYRIIKEIDRGGMAVVYKAHQLDLDRTVALKVLPANVTINRRFVERFLSEAHAVAKLNHQNIVSIHEVSMENNVYFLAMDYIPGLSLYYYLNQKKPKLVDVLEIFVQLADALAYAHEQRIIHRDLKLNNVIMKDNKSPVLIDFGLAKALEDEEGGITRTGEIMGSPAYMPPERILGGVSDVRGDVCSLGIMLYEMLTFKNPYLDPRSIHQTTMNVMEAAPIPPRKLIPWLPGEVEAITLKAMHKDPEKRYQMMVHFKEDIQRYQRGEQVLANPPSVWTKTRHFVRKQWAPLSFGAIILLFSVILGFVMHLQSRKERWRWQQVHLESFSDSASLTDWTSFPRPDEKGGHALQNHWRLKDGALHVSSSAASYIRLERPFTRDLRFEFDIHGGSDGLYNAGFFMCGDSPDSAYAFSIHRDATMLCGAAFQNSEYFFYDYNPMEFPAAQSYHVIVEKTENLITLKLNGYLVARIFDFFPLMGKKYQKMGFFTKGGECIFDNLRIYRRSVPMLASPTIIADRFWEHGEFETALNEYRELLLDFPRNDIVREVKLKIIDCLIRLGNFDEAGAMLEDQNWDALREEQFQMRLLHLRGTLARQQGRALAADSLFTLLNRYYPTSTRNYSVLAHQILEADKLLAQGLPDSAEKRIMHIAETRPRFSRACGRFHIRILQFYVDKGYFNEALAVGRRIIMLHAGEDDILSHTRTIFGKLYLGRGMKYKALEMLNRSTTTIYSFPELWEGWWTLGEVYEFDRKYKDAYQIYQKIYQECPPVIELPWLARLRMAEILPLIDKEAEEKVSQYIRGVIDGDHPFAIPRLVASYYDGRIEEKDFVEKWRIIRPLDRNYLYYCAQRAHMSGNRKLAGNYLQKLKNQYRSNSWERARVANSITRMR